MCLNGDVLKWKNETRMQQNVLYTQLVFSEICSKFRIVLEIKYNQNRENFLMNQKKSTRFLYFEHLIK